MNSFIAEEDNFKSSMRFKTAFIDFYRSFIDSVSYPSKEERIYFYLAANLARTSSKADWTCRFDRELCSLRVRIFFSTSLFLINNPSIEL